MARVYIFLYSCSSCRGILTFGILLCYTRLNFDYDIRRGTEEGPWIDAIPFDGRDVWQFTLVADDSLENMWRTDPASFVNLGPAHRPRCWPWSNDADLPYGRTGTDKDLRGPGPNGKRWYLFRLVCPYLHVHLKEMILACILLLC